MNRPFQNSPFQIDGEKYDAFQFNFGVGCLAAAALVFAFALGFTLGSNDFNSSTGNLAKNSDYYYYGRFGRH